MDNAFSKSKILGSKVYKTINSSDCLYRWDSKSG